MRRAVGLGRCELSAVTIPEYRRNQVGPDGSEFKPVRQLEAVSVAQRHRRMAQAPAGRELGGAHRRSGKTWDTQRRTVGTYLVPPDATDSTRSIGGVEQTDLPYARTAYWPVGLLSAECQNKMGSILT